VYKHLGVVTIVGAGISIVSYLHRPVDKHLGVVTIVGAGICIVNYQHQPVDKHLGVVTIVGAGICIINYLHRPVANGYSFCKKNHSPTISFSIKHTKTHKRSLFSKCPSYGLQFSALHSGVRPYKWFPGNTYYSNLHCILSATHASNAEA